MDEQKEASSKPKKYTLRELLRYGLIFGLIGGLEGIIFWSAYDYLSEEKWLVLVSSSALFLFFLMIIIHLREKE
jgi:hypothetical protein